jgi:hypothetical protein
MLASLFSGRFETQIDDNGAVFIDRDPTHFRHILNYLRDGTVPADLEQLGRQELMREADFFGLPELVGVLSGSRNSLDSAFPPLRKVGLGNKLKIVCEYRGCRPRSRRRWYRRKHD